MAIEPQVISGLKEFLGPEGIQFFREVKKEHGSLNAVWMEDGIPHAVHFREGMQVRNAMRRLTTNALTAIDYDEMWIEAVEECMKEDE
jgi:hypothetical protein